MSMPIEIRLSFFCNGCGHAVLKYIELEAEKNQLNSPLINLEACEVCTRKFKNERNKLLTEFAKAALREVHIGMFCEDRVKLCFDVAEAMLAEYEKRTGVKNA